MQTTVILPKNIQPKRDRTAQKRIMALKLLVIFFAAMVLLTILARCASSAVVPRVNVTRVGQGALNYSFELQGKVQPAKERIITAQAGMRVSELYVKQGQSVKEGDPLIGMDVSQKQEALQEAKSELARLKLAQKQPDGTQPVSDLDLQSALVRLENAKEDKLIAERESALKIERAEEDLESALEKIGTVSQKTAEDEIEAAQKRYDTAVEELDSTFFSREEAIKQCQRAIEDANIQWQNLFYNQDPEKPVDTLAITEAQAKLLRAQEDLGLTTAKWDTKLAKAQSKQTQERENLNKANSGEVDEDVVDAAREEAKRQEKALEDAKSAAQIATAKADRSIEDAELAIKDAQQRMQEQTGVANAQKQKDRLTKDQNALEIRMVEDKIAELEAIIQSGGEIRAQTDGVVTKVSTEVGRATTGEEVLRIMGNDDGLRVEMTASEEQAKHFSVGDSVMVQPAGQNDKLEGEILSINQSGDGFEVISTMPFENRQIGSGVSVSMQKSTDSFDSVIPIQALHQDSMGYFVLRVVEQNTIMGKEWAAEQASVDLIEKDGKKAAISGALGYDDKLISSSSKSVYEGDRVRIMEE